MLRNLSAARVQKGAPEEFFKMSGAGNDFVVMDNRSGSITNPEELTRKICMRRLSVGGDGFILIESSGKATFRMKYFNSDGSRADFCANGTRCAARFAFLNVIAPRKMTIETDAGVVGAEVHEQLVTLSLPSPRKYVRDLSLDVEGGLVRGHSILVGVPHYVNFVEGDLWRQQIDLVGRAIRFHPDLAPDGANVNFVSVRDVGKIEVRTYERGVEGETLACGSGVVAAAVVSALQDEVRSPVSVLTRSGISLSVSFTLGIQGGDSLVTDVRLTGDARVVYRSQLTAETTEGFDVDWVTRPVSKEG